MCILRGAAMFDFSIFSLNLQKLDNFELVDLKLWIGGWGIVGLGALDPWGEDYTSATRWSEPV